MFFGNSKHKDEEILKLKEQLSSLHQQLATKESEVEHYKKELASIDKEELSALRLENKKLKGVAAVSQDE